MAILSDSETLRAEFERIFDAVRAKSLNFDDLRTFLAIRHSEIVCSQVDSLKGQLASANQIIMPDHAPQPVTQTIGEGVVCRGGMSGKLKVWFDLTAELPEPSPLQVGDKVRVIVEKVSE